MWQSYNEITLVSVWISESWPLTMVFVLGILITCTNRSGAGASLRCRRSDAHWWRPSRSPHSWSPVARCGQASSLKKSPPLLCRRRSGRTAGGTLRRRSILERRSTAWWRPPWRRTRGERARTGARRWRLYFFNLISILLSVQFSLLVLL